MCCRRFQGGSSYGVCSVACFYVIFGTVFLVYAQIIFSSVRVMCYMFQVFFLVISHFGFEDKIIVLFESALGHCSLF